MTKTRADTTSINTAALIVHNMAKDKGWWTPIPDEDGHPRVKSLTECIALVMSECSEAIEAFREGGVANAFVIDEGKPEGWAVELIDAIIRILDTLMWYGIEPQRILDTKIRYNSTRSLRHGGKLL